MKDVIIGILLLFMILICDYVGECVRGIDRIITAEEYLMHPDYYQVDTIWVDGIAIYSVREE